MSAAIRFESSFGHGRSLRFLQFLGRTNSFYLRNLVDMSLAFTLLIWLVYIRPYMIELGHDDTLISMWFKFLGGMTIKSNGSLASHGHSSFSRIFDMAKGLPTVIWSRILSD